MRTCAGLLAALISTTALAGNPQFAEFAVQQAHKQGFKGCDAAIREMHEHAGGEDIRVNVTTFQNNPNILSMVSTWGAKGDSIFAKSTFVNRGKNCLYDTTTIITSNKSCLAYAQGVPAFTYSAEVGDYIWMKNKGGVNLLLTPVDDGCVATFTVDQEA